MKRSLKKRFEALRAMKFKAFLPFFVLILFASHLAGEDGQRYAHCDMEQVWRSLPEAKDVEQELKSLEEGCLEDLNGMMKEYRKAQEQDPEKWRTWSTEKLDPSLQVLQRMEERILRYKDKMQRSIHEKEKALLPPLCERVRRSIRAVAEQRGSAYVFDSSSFQLLYAEGVADITQAVIMQFGPKNRKTLRP